MLDDFKNGGDDNVDFKRMSQYRAQFLPNGGLMGERLQKTISMYRAANKSLNEPRGSAGALATVDPKASDLNPYGQNAL